MKNINLPGLVKNLPAIAYDHLIAGKEKAAVAFLMGAVGSFLAKHGLTLHADTLQYIDSAVLGLVAHLFVYFTPNKKA